MKELCASDSRRTAKAGILEREGKMVVGSRENLYQGHS